MKRPSLSYANVMATIAVFIALGGSAFAATQLKRNSVGTKQLKAGAVTGAKVAKNTLTGENLALSTLGTVPSAAVALHATTADTATTATTATSATTATHATTADTATTADMTHADTASVAQEIEGYEIGCPAGTTLIRGICFDANLNPVVNGVQAAADGCAAKGGFLPTLMELYSARGAINVGSFASPPNFAITDSVFADPIGKSHYSVMGVQKDGTVQIFEDSVEARYICAYPLVR